MTGADTVIFSWRTIIIPLQTCKLWIEHTGSDKEVSVFISWQEIQLRKKIMELQEKKVAMSNTIVKHEQFEDVQHGNRSAP
jgi:hypothetical protein